jgi:hypothetical protein
MRPVPQTSELRLVSGVPGTEVWVGGRRSGSIGSDGSLLLSGLPAGAGRVELRRDGYPSREIPIELEAGRATEIQATMDAAARGVLSLVLSPAEAGAKVSLRRSDGSAPQDVRGDRLNLAPGAYVVEAQASGFQPARNEVEIRAGETSVVRLELRRIEAAGGPAARGPIDYMPLWAAQEGWSPRGTQLVRRGGEFVYAPVKPQSGVYRFSAIRQAGDRLYWFVSLGDQRDHWIFELGRRRFDRIRVSGGKRIRESRYEKGADRGEPFDVEIEVQPGLVTTRVSSNGAVLAEDRLEGEGGDLHTGRWGFWLDGGDQLALTAFSFEAR